MFSIGSSMIRNSAHVTDMMLPTRMPAVTRVAPYKCLGSIFQNLSARAFGDRNVTMKERFRSACVYGSGE